MSLEHAFSIWDAALNAVRPGPLLNQFFLTHPDVSREIAEAKRLLVVGAGKAGASMAAALEKSLPRAASRMQGIVNVPAPDVSQLSSIVLHPARPAGSNHPTELGVLGAQAMLDLLSTAGPDDIAICLLSGGGSALLPAPAKGITLEEKQQVTRLLHAAGATIDEMNCVRKHLSRIKGGRLAEAFHGRTLISLILSDVVGDPLDVIASGPTAPDPSTYQDAIAVLERHELQNQVSRAVLELLQSGARGELPETLKVAMPNVQHYILGNNAIALASAELAAARLGYHIINLGSYLEGESAALATVIAGMVRSIREQNIPHAPPVCLLMGGETTVRLDTDSGKGGRNQEFVLALAHTLGEERLRGITILSAGTDGEDGPTDAAGGYLNAELYASARAKKLDPALHLRQHNTYPFLDAVGGLLRTGLTQTNVMDVRIVLIGE